MAKWIIGIVVVVALAFFAWHAGWFGGHPPVATTTPPVTQQTTTTPQDTTGLPTSQTDTSDQAIARDTAAIDVQIAGLGADIAALNKALSDTSISATTKAKADQEIDRRVAALNDLLSRIQAMVRVNATFKQNLTTNTQNQIQALSTLKAKIDADTDPATLKNYLKTLSDNYRTFVLVVHQGRISASADRIANLTAMMQGVGIKLQAKLQALAGGGVTVTAQGTTLNDLGAKITDAQSKAQASITVIAPLVPDNGDKTVQAANAKAFVTAKADLTAAQKDLTDARKDIASIIKFLATAHASSTPATASTTISI